MLSILAFDSFAIKSLLSDRYAEYFEPEYPLFYKNRYNAVRYDEVRGPVKVYRYNNAIDVAINNNAIRGVNLIIQHIVKHQNSFVSSFLFYNNLLKIMEKGINTHELLDSNVFQYKLDFDEWPYAHTKCVKVIESYNGSLFNLRHKYLKVFPELAYFD